MFGLISTASVTVDGKQLEQIYEYEKSTKDKFWIENDKDYSSLYVGRESTTPTSKVKITFSLKEDVTQYYLICAYDAIDAK